MSDTFTTVAVIPVHSRPQLVNNHKAIKSKDGDSQAWQTKLNLPRAWLLCETNKRAKSERWISDFTLI
ncbi:MULTISPECIES: hypothetical protein [Pseudoalteromonas]|nr:hypothetical protein [Pseudoalteromonas sp. NJ631]